MAKVTKKVRVNPYPGTRLRSFRMDEVWDEAIQIAKERGEDVSSVVLRPAVTRYVKRHRKE